MREGGRRGGGDELQAALHTVGQSGRAQGNWGEFTGAKCRGLAQSLRCRRRVAKPAQARVSDGVAGRRSGGDLLVKSFSVVFQICQAARAEHSATTRSQRCQCHHNRRTASARTSHGYHVIDKRKSHVTPQLHQIQCTLRFLVVLARTFRNSPGP